MAIGNNIKASDKETIVENTTFDKYNCLEYYNCYNISEIADYDVSVYEIPVNYDDSELEVSNPENPIQSLGGPMDSAWPMYCHDVCHTGRSPYSTVDTWDEIWRFKQHVNDYVRGSPVVGDDGTIYFGGMDFYALYPNGTMKWRYDDLSFYVWSAPAIDENGIIYVGDLDGYFYAINPDGTEKWKSRVGKEILSSPAIGDDGIIYLGTSFYYPDGYFYALYPNNGSVKWRYKTDHVVYSSPAIGSDGTVYCGSHDTYLYALYPNNGTLKWKYKTDHWIRTSPCIADDGTIYVVSLDNHLHAVKALVLKKGYREKSHFCLYIAFKELYINQKLMKQELGDNFELCMRLRYDADYGLLYNKESAVTAIKYAETILKEALKLL